MTDAEAPVLKKTASWSARTRRVWWLAGLFLLAMASELIVPSAMRWWPRPIEGEEPYIAVHLYHGHGFLSPLDSAADAKPTSWSPPLYPALLSVVYHIFGTAGLHLLIPLKILQAIFFGIVTLGLFRLGELIFSRAVGVGVAIAHVIYPAFLHYAADFWDAYAALAIFVWLLVMVAHLRRRKTGMRDGGALGLILGILSLTNAAYALAYPVIVLAAAAGRKMSVRLALAGVALLVFLVTLAPWTIRNYERFGRLFYIRDGVKLELWLGNHGRANGWFGHANRELHPTHNPEEREALLNLGETAYFDQCLKRFKEDYAADPEGFWRRTAWRTVFCVTGEPERHTRKMSPWTYPFSGIALNPLNALLSLLGIAGAMAAWRLRYRCGWIMASGVLGIAPYCATSVYNRYLLPLRVVFMFYAVFLVMRVGGWVRRRVGASEGKQEPGAAR